MKGPTKDTPRSLRQPRITAILFCFSLALTCTAYTVEKPNVIIILVDDMGYSDVSCYGGEIDTPNLNHLAANGLRFTQFYNTARCWPTRAALMTGYYAQQVNRDALPGLGGGGRDRCRKNKLEIATAEEFLLPVVGVVFVGVRSEPSRTV